MNEWRNELERKLSNMSASKKLTDYESVKARFSSIYNGIIKEPAKKDRSFFDEHKTDDIKAYFYISKYALCLEKNRETIDVFSIDDTSQASEKKEKIAEITFKGEFAIGQFILTNVGGRSFYLSDDYIDQLFKLAYKPLLSN